MAENRKRGLSVRLTAETDTSCEIRSVITQLGLLPANQLVSIPTGVSSEELCAELVGSRRLTKYQAERLLGDRHGLVMGAYLLLEPLGQGHDGQVFKALHRKMNRTVALKILRIDDRFGSEPYESEGYRRFRKEMEAIGRLDNPHIIHPFDSGQCGDSFYLAMEYVGGTDLKRLVESGGPLSVFEAVEYTRQCAIGLQHAAEHGLVHRDIKPANILLTKPRAGFPIGCVKLLDLGIARIRKIDSQETQSQLTDESQVIGTADYMSPEQGSDARSVDIRSDLYSLGCTLFYLLTGRPPFQGGSAIVKLLRHATEPVPHVDTFRDDVPACVSMILTKLMAKRPPDRYATAIDVVVALDRTLAELSVPQGIDPLESMIGDVGDQPAPEVRAAGHTKRSRAKWFWLVLALVIVSATAVVGMRSKSASPGDANLVTNPRPGENLPKVWVPFRVRIDNASFEDPINQGSSVGWAFHNTRVIENNSPGLGNADAPNGKHAAFFQGGPGVSIAQNVFLEDGVYALSFQAAQRTNNHQTLRITIGERVVGLVTPTDRIYRTYSSNNFTVRSGTYRLAFEGMNPLGGDNSAMIDAISITALGPHL